MTSLGIAREFIAAEQVYQNRISHLEKLLVELVLQHGEPNGAGDPELRIAKNTMNRYQRVLDDPQQRYAVAIDSVGKRGAIKVIVALEQAIEGGSLVAEPE